MIHSRTCAKNTTFCFLNDAGEERCPLNKVTCTCNPTPYRGLENSDNIIQTLGNETKNFCPNCGTKL